MRRWFLLIVPLVLVASCGRHVPPSEVPAAVVPNLPFFNPARPVTDESLTSLEAEFRRVAQETVASMVESTGGDEPPFLDAHVVRLFSKEKVLWVEVRLGTWWDSLDAARQDELLAELGRQLYSLDEEAFNQKRDVILTAKGLAGRRLGDATVTPLSIDVRLAAGPESAFTPRAANSSAKPR